VKNASRLLVFAAAALVAAATVGCSSGSHRAKSQPPRPTTNPYLASLAYAKCLRRRGVPHPLPDRRGEFSLTPAQERKLRQVPKARREAGMKACFHNLAGLNNDPLSERAHRRAIKVLRQLKKCLGGFGYEVGRPMVRNLSFGRAMFGFTNTGGPAPARGRRATARRAHAQQVCEKRVDMARKLTRIINEDRRTHHGGV
jgi:hypothetical protein